MLKHLFFASYSLGLLLLSSCNSNTPTPEPETPELERAVDFTLYGLDYSHPRWDSVQVKVHLQIGRHVFGGNDTILFDTVLLYKVQELPSLDNALRIEKTITGIIPGKNSHYSGYAAYYTEKVNGVSYHLGTFASSLSFAWDSTPVSIDVCL